uniref:DUF3417 domain-containing protein n=1 Tax=Cupriavidus necator TaxID=106590 RepID=UPI003F4948CF
MYAFLPRTLPERLSALTELALDLRWTWSHALDALWQTIGPKLWARSHNPCVILQNIPQNRLDELVSDSTFLQDLNRRGRRPCGSGKCRGHRNARRADRDRGKACAISGTN